MFALRHRCVSTTAAAYLIMDGPYQPDSCVACGLLNKHCVRPGLEFGLHSLPKEVLLRIIGLAALPLGMWMRGLPKLSTTEGLPEKPLPLEALREHHHAPTS